MPWLPKKFVVVPVDFSDESFAAIQTALQFVEEPAQLHVLNVLPLIEPSDPEYLWTSADAPAREMHAVQALNERLAALKITGVSIHTAVGDPGHKVADFAAENHAELIILPSHGRTGISRLLIGSTAERVVRLAHCPVLVLRK
ncbi:MAG: universal stress protein [Planctomycetia bacterium]|nr:universal stress protein [Planctomycetia bacterium]